MRHSNEFRSKIAKLWELGVFVVCALSFALTALAQNSLGDGSIKVLQFEVLQHQTLQLTNEIIIWVSSSASLNQQTFSTLVPKALTPGQTLIALPLDSTKSLGISKILIQCAENFCRNFTATAVDFQQINVGHFKRVHQKRIVEVHTSQDVSHVWYRDAELYSLIVDGVSSSSFRLQELDGAGQLLFDAEGPMTHADGVCVGLNDHQPWRGQVQACLAGLGPDGSLLIRVTPVLVLANPIVPFGLPIDAINTATRNHEEVSIWLKVMPENFSVPTVKSTEDVHQAVGIAGQIFNEVEDSIKVPLVKNRIEKVWAKKALTRLGDFLSLLKTPQNIKPQNRQRACQARAMLNILAGRGLPQVTSLVTLIESDFSATDRSDKGALGFWQFIPQTALDYGLKLSPVDERTLIGPSTDAASRYLISSLAHYSGPNSYKFALASYNSGVKNVDQQIQSLPHRQSKSQGYKKGHNDVILKFQDLVSASGNFWDLYSYGLLYSETQMYVIDIMAASYLALHPERVHLAPELTLDDQRSLPKLNCADSKIAKK